DRLGTVVHSSVSLRAAADSWSVMLGAHSGQTDQPTMSGCGSPSGGSGAGPLVSCDVSWPGLSCISTAGRSEGPTVHPATSVAVSAPTTALVVRARRETLTDTPFGSRWSSVLSTW